MSLREYNLSSGKKLLLGKSAETNEDLIDQTGPGETVFHTSKPGSPFANIKGSSKEIKKSEIYEAAVICAKYSQDWRDNRGDVQVHYFLKEDIKKDKDMPKGTFFVRNYKCVKVKKGDILNFEKQLENGKTKN